MGAIIAPWPAGRMPVRSPGRPITGYPVAVSAVPTPVTRHPASMSPVWLVPGRRWRGPVPPVLTVPFIAPVTFMAAMTFMAATIVTVAITYLVQILALHGL